MNDELNAHSVRDELINFEYVKNFIKDNVEDIFFLLFFSHYYYNNLKKKRNEWRTLDLGVNWMNDHLNKYKTVKELLSWESKPN